MYFTYNAVVFGGVVPVSGATKLFWSQSSWELEGGYSLAANLHAFLGAGYFDDELLIALEVCVYAGLVWWFSRRSRSREDWLLLAFLVGAFGLAAGHVAQFAQHVLTVHPDYGNYHWYYVPAYLMMALVVPARCCVAVWFVRRFVGPGVGNAAKRSAIIGVVMIGAVSLFAKTDFAAPFRSGIVDQRVTATDRDWAISSYMSAMVLNRVLPEDSVIGATDSGIIGYFSRFPVMNLDGLANSWDYLRLRGEEELRQQLRQQHGITHWFYGDGITSQPDDSVLFEGPLFHHAQAGGRFKLRCEGDASTTASTCAGMGDSAGWAGVDRSAWFRERMEPHLERRPDGVGLLVDGRLVQAFLETCAPDELAKWTWGPPGRGETAIRPWTQTEIGFCTSAVVGPPGVSSSVRVATMTMDEYLTERLGDRRPTIRSGFDVYLVDDALVYVKEQCGPEDADGWFFLHVEAVDPDDLPGPRRPYGFDNLDFSFYGRSDGPGARVGGKCLLEIALPNHPVAAIRTGQYVEAAGGVRFRWRGEVRVGPGGVALGEHLAGRVEGLRPAIESGFDVYLVDDALVYVKEQCGPEDADGWFFLHVEAVDSDDLPGPRRQYGFDNFDFGFDGRGARFDGGCLAEAPLPDYPVAAIRTGQYVEAADGVRFRWRGEVRVGPGVPPAPAGGHLASLRVAWLVALADRVRGLRPAIDSDFDVYLVESRLVYLKESCGPDDVDAPFFVHVEPTDPDDLPGPLRRQGFDNLDFRFDGRGARFDGVCLAEVMLPEYGIAAIRTGQYVAVEDGVHQPWKGEVRFGVRRPD